MTCECVERGKVLSKPPRHKKQGRQYIKGVLLLRSDTMQPLTSSFSVTTDELL
jgi:hypothetical protein